MSDAVVCWVCGTKADPGAGHLELLKRMRIQLTEDMFSEATHPRDRTAVSRQLLTIAKEIDTLEERARLEGKKSGHTSRTGKADSLDV